MTTRDDFRFFHRLRVRWAEVDKQDIVFNAHYLMYFDTAITGYWRAIAMPYAESMAALGGDLYVKKSTLEFHASARMEDDLDVALKCARIGTSSMTFQGGIFRGEELLITGEIIYVFADPATQTSRPVPQVLRDLLTGYEAGEDMVAVRTGRWADLQEPASRIRRQVFIEEQHIPAELEWDEADHEALHAVAFNRLGGAIGTGRLLRGEPGVGRIGRMAVHRSMRGGGVGEQMVRALADAAQARGDRRILLHAQRTAQPFYARLGFRPVGEPFTEAGIPHQEMAADLPLAH
jgi:YbgC/YbaW family acyl-CoA thioester hydrolase